MSYDTGVYQTGFETLFGDRSGVQGSEVNPPLAAPEATRVQGSRQN